MFNLQNIFKTKSVSSKLDLLCKNIFFPLDLQLFLFDTEGQYLFSPPCGIHKKKSSDEGFSETIKTETLRLVKKVIKDRQREFLFLEKSKCTNLYLVPFESLKGSKIGVLCALKIGKKSDENEKEKVFTFIQTMSYLVAENIYQNYEIKNLTEDLSLKFEELSLIYEISDNTNINSSISKSIEYIVRKSIDLVNPHFVVWAMENEENQIFYLDDFSKDKKTAINRRNIDAVCKGIKNMRNDMNLPLTVNKIGRYKKLSGTSFDDMNLLSVPVVSGDKSFGTLNFFKHDPKNFFLNDHLKLMETIAKSMANVIKNGELYQQIQNLLFNIVKMLLDIIENKDVYTTGHSKRVYEISISIGELMKLNEQKMFDLKWASIIHDLGKINISSEIVKKPGKLTYEEYEIIKTHPVEGAKLISHIVEFKNSAEGILHHHERIDGKGYPDGIKDDKIPLISKIISVADSFDALNSDRPYRKRLTLNEVLIEIKKSAGTQLDAYIVDLFLKNSQMIICNLEETISIPKELSKIG